MRFKKLYTVAISLIIILLLVNQVVIQYWLQQKSTDAHVINISGKQRMLSQKLFGLIQYYQADTSNGGIKEDIQQSFNSWLSVHNDLLNGNEIPNYIKLELDIITPNVKFVAELMTDINQPESLDISQLHSNQAVFLSQMDYVVSLLEKNSKEKLSTIVRIEFILAFFTLIVIFLEIQYIFRPIIRQLAFRNEELNKQNQVLEEYAYIASHDLRTPIQNLLNFLGLLKVSVESKLDDTENIYLQFIEESANRMNRTTKDLLDYSVANQISLEIVDVNNIVKEVLEDLSIQIEDKKATIDVNNIPNKSLVDEDLFRLLLQNLISNGLKFVPTERAPHLQIWSVSDKNYQYFYVKDNGIGIAKESKEKIFKIFQRLHNKEEYKGTGIGLALCKRIVEGHGGEIWLESEEGIGSSFIFKIPKEGVNHDF